MVLSRGPVLLVAALSALSWNFLFIPPLFTLHIAKFEDALTFATYFIIALTVGSLTAQLKAREHLAAQVQLAQESERLRKTLLDCVSHELKTPLAAIGAASQELLRLAPNAQNAEMLKQLAGEIHDGSHRLNRVVNNLLDMNRLESGVIQPKLRMVRRARAAAVGDRDRARIDRRPRDQAGRAGEYSARARGSYIDRAGGREAARQRRQSHSVAIADRDRCRIQRRAAGHLGERSRTRASRRNQRSAFSKNFIAATAARPAVSVSDYRSRAASSKRMAANSRPRIATAAARASPSACRFA